MGLAHPELLLLLLPALWACWRWRPAERAGQLLRLLVALLLGCALAGPYWKSAQRGSDLVIVVDRSRSMPAGSDALAREQIALAEEARRAGDRVAVVSFGRAALIERLPSESAHFAGFAQSLDREASDLGGAIDRALSLIPRERPAALLVLSDGLANGLPPLPAARRALARGIPVHVKPLLREAGDLVSVDDLDVPAEVAQGEPFQIACWVWAERATECELALTRDGAPLATQHAQLEAGPNRVLFRDRLGSAGAAAYELRASAPGDREPENDRAIAATRVFGQRRVLVINHDGREDALVGALRAAALDVTLSAPERAPLTRLSLSSFRAVVLENVAHDRLRGGVPALREFVEQHGGGLLLTGGKASFALGGYYLSAIDALLPVSMEQRQEWRKQGVAIAFALDRSGSMAAPVGTNLTKMDLANQGTIAALRVLAAQDACAVIAVDSTNHTVVPLSPADDLDALCNEVSGIRSEGGGIYVRTAIEAAAEQLQDAVQQNRHIVLFADAADAEEPEGVTEICQQLRAEGITTSVIALGSETDSDAAFLKDVAAAGEGTISFCQDPADLPRVFAQDTLRVSRSTFVEEPCASSAQPGLLGLGDWMPKSGPALGGYNLTWLRPKSSLGLVSEDENRAPIFAYRHVGLGRTAAFMGELGGSFGQGVLAWDGFASLCATCVRWLAGPQDPTGLYTNVRREGGDAVVEVEIDGTDPAAPDPAGMRVRLSSPQGGAPRELALQRVTEGRFEARLPLPEQGVYLGEIALQDGGFAALPPVALPYSPELERRDDPRAGEHLLERIARESGGRNSPAVPDAYPRELEGRGWHPLAPWLTGIALALLLLEIAARRLQLYALLRWPAPVRAIFARRVFGRASAGAARERAAVPAMAANGGSGAAASAASRAQQPGSSGAAPAPTSGQVPPAGAPPAEVAGPSLTDALAKARRSARRETGR